MAKTSIREDIQNAADLERHVRENVYRPRRSWFDRRVDLPTFVLAVLGAVFSIGFVAAAFYPLAAISHKYWFGG